MDHAINGIREYMNATIAMWQGQLSKEEIKPEIRAYVKAINALEEYYYGEKKTSIDSVLAFYE